MGAEDGQYSLKVTYNLLVEEGLQLQPLLLKLDAQQTPIKGIACDNNNSKIEVHIYQGVSPHGVPFIVLPGRTVRFSMSGPSAVYCTFSGPSTSDGNIYLEVSDTYNELFAANISGDVEIDTSTPLDVNVKNTTSDPVPIQGTVGIALQPIQTQVTNTPLPVSVPSPLPVQATGVTAAQITGPFPLQVDLSQTNANATPIVVAPNPVNYPPAPLGTRINTFVVLTYNATTPRVQLLTQPSTGLHAFFTNIEIWGMDRQPAIEWILQGVNNVGGNVNLLRGWKDKTMIFSGPYFICPSVTVTNGIFFNIANQNAIINALQIRVGLQGWWGN